MTTFTEPFWMMYHEVPSSPWLNTAWTNKRHRIARLPLAQTGFQVNSQQVQLQAVSRNIQARGSERAADLKWLLNTGCISYEIMRLWELCRESLHTQSNSNKWKCSKNTQTYTHINIYIYMLSSQTNGNLHTVPAFAWDSKITTLASSLFTCTASKECEVQKSIRWEQLFSKNYSKMAFSSVHF